MALENSGGPISEDSEEELFVFPTSFAQQRLWFLEQLIPNTCLYNVPTVFRLTGLLDVTALEQSFQELVCRHEILRTTFVEIAGEPAQAIAPHLDMPLPIIDLQHCPVAERAVEAQQVIRTEMQRPFNLAQGPLIRLMLFRLATTEHILLISLHHIIFDEWSSGVLIRELGALYGAWSAGQPSPLPELPIQYADFAHWQRQWLQGEILEAQLAYWRQQLRDVPVLNLPIDDVAQSSGERHPAKTPSYRGALHQVELTQDLAIALNALSQEAGTTLFMTLLAAFQTLLYRYTGQTDIPIGSPIANRNRSELENLIGFFANSLVLRGDLAGNPTFKELLERSRQMTLAAYAHQDVPFEKLVEELQPSRNLSRNPLFQVVFALQNAPMTQLELPGLTLDAIEFDTRNSRFDLELYLWECGENFRSLWGQGWQNSAGFRGVVVYNTDLFQPETIARLMRSLQTLLEAIVANPNQRLADLPVLTATERRQILIDWNQTQTDYPKFHSIHELFEAQVAKLPEAIAVQFGNQFFTYQALNQGSNQLAHYLQKLGVGAKAFVGVCLDRSSEMVAALLGILKAGAAYVPLDPTYPLERLRFMLADAQISVLLTQTQYQAQFQDCPTQVVCLDQVWTAIAQESQENLPNLITAEDLAYVVYTSGSTGQPKGVMVPQRAVTRLVCNTNYIQICPGDRIAQVSNISFDAATFEIWGALLNGAQLVGIDREVSLSPLEFAATLHQQQIDILFLTTALFNQVAREVPTAFHGLRYLLFGGEVADLQQVKAVLQAGVPQHLLHVYGPTESTTFATWYEVQTLPETATSLPIGRSVTNTQLYILDAHLQPVPIGVKGELYIGGDGLATGYLNQTELTAERFISPSSFILHSITTQKQATSFILLYKTGDLARYLPDGNIEFLGRSDHQVKLRGFRIELGEVETALQQHSQVQAAIAMLQSSQTHGQSLVAYVVPSQKPAPTPSDLRNFLKTKLPEHMIPTAIALLETLPLTPNGKVDRRALPAVSFNHQERETAAQAPQTETEQKLATIWVRLLGLSQVGIHDNFFELGGHSLLATQLMSRIRDALQVELPLRSLFEAPTIADLAKQIETHRWAGRRLAVSGSGVTVGREEVEF
ncbi:MAG TPA: amino acid adenylation domain-containing protein [Allocoleopsis sp.]